MLTVFHTARKMPSARSIHARMLGHDAEVEMPSRLMPAYFRPAIRKTIANAQVSALIM